MRLYHHFFHSCTQKVWGIDPKLIRADWAAQRIRNLSLRKAVWNALTGTSDTASLIEEFDFPRLGPGQMWERTAELIEAAGGEVRRRTWVTGVEREGARVTALAVLFVRRPRHAGVRAAIVVLAVGLIANAFVFGGLSAPVGRYQARVIWLVPLLAGVLLLGNRARAAAERAAP